MKPFRGLVVVSCPPETLFATVRDRLPELAALMDDVAEITELERKVLSPTRLRIVNAWRSTRRIPELLAPALPSGEVRWIDRNEWDAEDSVCRWTVEPTGLPAGVECAGITTYEAAMGGRGARVTVSGTFDLPNGLADLPRALERPVTAFVESVFTTLVPRNARRMIEAAAELAGAASAE